MIRVIKIGGAIVDDEAILVSTLTALAPFAPFILIHGGGRVATDLARQLGIQQTMVNGRRVTDADTLKVVVQTYSGLINKTIVARLQALGVNTIGMTGADLDVVRAHRRAVGEIDYGFVGDVDDVRRDVLQQLLSNGQSIVLAPITHDGAGTLLNTNADTLASAVASALGKDAELVFLFEHAGVLRDVRDTTSTIPSLSRKQASQLIADGILTDGMLPKLEAAFAAAEAGVAHVRITRYDTPYAGTQILGEQTL